MPDWESLYKEVIERSTCVTHHICACHAEKMALLEAEIAELRGWVDEWDAEGERLWAVVKAARQVVPPL